MQRVSNVAFNQLCLNYAPELAGLPDLTETQLASLDFTSHRRKWTGPTDFAHPCPLSLLAHDGDLKDLGISNEPRIDLDMPPSPWRAALMNKINKYKDCCIASVSPAAWASVLSPEWAVVIRVLDIKALRIGRAHGFWHFSYDNGYIHADYRYSSVGYVVNGGNIAGRKRLRAVLRKAGLLEATPSRQTVRHNF